MKEEAKNQQSVEETVNPFQTTDVELEGEDASSLPRSMNISEEREQVLQEHSKNVVKQKMFTEHEGKGSWTDFLRKLTEKCESVNEVAYIVFVTIKALEQMKQTNPMEMLAQMISERRGSGLVRPGGLFPGM